MMIQKEIKYVPGLYKIFDEILVNAVVNKHRDFKMDTIKVDIDVWHHLHLLPYTLKKLSCTEFADENAIFTVEQYRTIKAAIELSASVGIIPSLLPQIKAHISMVRAPKCKFMLNLESDGVMEKHKPLSHTTTVLLELFEKSIFRAAVMAQLDCLLAALLRLAHAPLKRPVEAPAHVSNADFNMTPQLYSCLKNEQSSFHDKLQTLMDDCPQSLLVKEMMVLLSIKDAPKWLQLNIKRHLTKRIMLPGGILALTLAICDEVPDLRKWPDKIEITELPISMWTQVYKETILEPVLHGSDKTPPLITDYKQYNTDTQVHFVVTLQRDKLNELERDGLHKAFKLQSTMSITSMCAFDDALCLKRFDNVTTVMKTFFKVRLDLYQKRKDYLEGILQAEAARLSNQARFILEKCDGTLTVENKKKKEMIAELVRRGYDSDPVIAWKLTQNLEQVLEEVAKAQEQGLSSSVVLS